MTYAVISDIQMLLPEFVIDGTSVPTDTQVETMISWAQSKINANLAYCGYETPLTDADDISRVQEIIAKKVASDSWKIHFVGRNLPQRIISFDKETDEFMAYLEKCLIKLPSGDPDNSSQQITAGWVQLGSFIYDES